MNFHGMEIVKSDQSQEPYPSLAANVSCSDVSLLEYCPDTPHQDTEGNIYRTINRTYCRITRFLFISSLIDEICNTFFYIFAQTPVQ